ncbi:MAG: alkaline phosphatase, partial [Comamonas sp.]
MSEVMTSRRRLLQLLGGAPLLPLSSALSAAGVLTACGGGDDTQAAFKSVSFSNMPAPTLAKPAEMATTTTSAVMSILYADNSTRDVKLAYEPFFVSGDLVSDGKGGKILAGGYVDINHQPIIDTTVPGSERQFFSDAPDGTSLLTVADAKVDGVKGKPVFAVVQFEYTTWAQDGKTDMYG